MGTGQFPHPEVIDLMQKYLDVMKSKVISPATADLKALSRANPTDRGLQNSVRFAERRIDARIRRIERLFKTRPTRRSRKRASR